MQGMLNLQKLQNLASIQQQKTSMPASLVGLAAGLSTATCLNSPLNLSLGSSAASAHSDAISSAAAATAATMASNLSGSSGGGGDATSKMPQLILASGQMLQGVQGAQLLIPTSKGTFSNKHRQKHECNCDIECW